MLAVRSLHRVRSQRLDTLHDLGQSFGFRDHKRLSLGDSGSEDRITLGIDG
jgi:hypothetical protein